MKDFLKGIVVGLGAVSPGLSGSILLVMFGLYEKIVYTVSHIFKNFKKNILFLLPLFLGIGVGILAFSTLVDDVLLAYCAQQTYFLFLGLIVGTLPTLVKEVCQKGFHWKYFFLMVPAFGVGMTFFILAGSGIEKVTDPNPFQSILLGVAVAASYLIPGVDSAAILSSFGLYELWTDSLSLSSLNLKVLIPAAFGVAVAGVLISFLFSKLLSKWYTGTYSAIFGLFLAVVLNFAYSECFFNAERPLGDNWQTYLSLFLMLVGFVLSLVFGQLDFIMARIKQKSGLPAVGRK